MEEQRLKEQIEERRRKAASKIQATWRMHVQKRIYQSMCTRTQHIILSLSSLVVAGIATLTPGSL